MRAQAGDRIAIESERAGQPGRGGVIEEILGEDPTRVRVRWDDGHTSVLTPAAGGASNTPANPPPNTCGQGGPLFGGGPLASTPVPC
jgi:hypothetical protein